ncbi:MAG TPA: hypothetical protein VGG34_04385 [Opitutaceae bacterium]
MSRICLAASALVLSAGAAFAQEDVNKALIDLLVKKGVLSQQDVSNLQAELAANQATQQTTTTTTTSSAASAPEAAPATAVPVVVDTTKGPLAFRVGNVSFAPFGFLDFTAVYRNEATGSAIGTSFNSIPYSNGSTGQLSETKFSAQNSRLGVRIDSEVNDTKATGYLETDFLGNAPTNLGVSSNSATMRLRNYFIDLRNGPWEFLAGQDWSMFTPNRKGISPYPSDVFYTNDMDTNYQAGLTWARQPQVRFLYHPTDEFVMGISLENPDQYVGSAVVLPAAFSATEVDQGTATSQPNPFPDVIGKMAYDTKAINGLNWHFELTGMVRSFKVNTFSSTINTDDTKEGEGVQGAVDLELIKGLNLIATGFYSYGGGRYINGLGPDFVITPPGPGGDYGIGLVKSESGIIGLEFAAAPTDTISAYFSEAEFGDRWDKVGSTYVGYGYPGSANSNNKTITEWTLDDTYTFWKSSTYGALQLIGQVSYVNRTPWYVAPGTPSSANTTMVFLDLRYVLP